MEAAFPQPAGVNLADACVIVLAAGRGERFLASGGTTHKLDADIGGKTVLQRSLQAAHASGCAVFVVRPEVALAHMGDSIAAGVLANPDARAWLVLPADLPLVQPATIASVARDVLTRGERAAARPRVSDLEADVAGGLGHPVGFGRGLRSALLACAGQAGAASVWRAAHSALLASTDLGCVCDVDTVAALERVRALWLAAQTAVERG
jgi:molybdenum cofactor cytidylyltransferase